MANEGRQPKTVTKVLRCHCSVPRAGDASPPRARGSGSWQPTRGVPG